MQQLHETVRADVERIQGGDRRALSKAITLMESQHQAHLHQARALLAAVLPASGRSLRIGVTGNPGVGKSTFIEATGSYLVSLGRRVAVLPVDPSSPVAGGSILGDKTRMQKLAAHTNAFIRPSASGTVLGGVARRTRESILLCEAAGYDVVIVETVGVGQSDCHVARLVDVCILLTGPESHDELQIVKRGGVELADVIVVNKADGPHAEVAEQTAQHYAHLLNQLDRHESPNVLVCSALEQRNIDTVWSRVAGLAEAAMQDGRQFERRSRQSQAWMHDLVLELLQAKVAAAQVSDEWAIFEELVADGRLLPHDAAHRIMQCLFSGNGDEEVEPARRDDTHYDLGDPK